MKPGNAVLFSLWLFSTSSLWCDPRTPLAFDAFDGGVLSAETLGRGGTFASNVGSFASGSENPAALKNSLENAFYATALIDSHSDLPESTVRLNDPLYGKVLHYLSMGANSGVLFFEPLGRQSTQSATEDFEFSANALGVAGASSFGKQGHFGASLAYLWSHLAVVPYAGGVPLQSDLDSAAGFRMNLGLRYPTGPFMWGASVQNAPGYLWWKHHKRDLLPVKVRIGNSWRIAPGILLSVDGEKRYYKEGSRKENALYVGSESHLSKFIVLRAGVFGDKIDTPKDRHWTGGLTYIWTGEADITYAIESYELDGVKVNRSFLSLRMPFST